MRLLNRFKKFSNKNNVLVYQMGKVGSTTLESQIKGSVHLHTLYNNNPCFVHAKKRRGEGLGKIKNILFDWIRLLAVKSRSEVKIITLIRDPIERDVSMFFQDLPFWLSHHIVENKVQTKDEGLGILFDAFNETYDRGYALNWFDKEIKRLTKIDVYDSEFDRDKGWELYEKGRYKVLLLELSKLDSCKEVVEDFVGGSLEDTVSNVGTKKWYSPVYKEFKEKITLDEAYVREVKGSKFYNHFYGVK